MAMRVAFRCLTANFSPVLIQRSRPVQISANRLLWKANPAQSLSTASRLSTGNNLLQRCPNWRTRCCMLHLLTSQLMYGSVATHSSHRGDNRTLFWSIPHGTFLHVSESVNCDFYIFVVSMSRFVNSLGRIPCYDKGRWVK